MRVAICVPRRADNGRRDLIWKWLRHQWLEVHHDWPIYEGTDIGEPFSIGAARNNAVKAAGDRWDVVVIVDGDTITEPSALEAAVNMAACSNKIIVAGDMRMLMDQSSTDRILSGGMWFPRPEGYHYKDNCRPNTCYGEPSSGALAIGRPLWEAMGGYPELKGWGWEDLALLTMAHVYGGGMDWVPDSILLHCYHEHTKLTEDSHRNLQIWQHLHELSGMENKQDLVRTYLATLGHVVP